MPNRTSNVHPIRGRSSSTPSKQELASLLSEALASASEIPGPANATGHRKSGPDRRASGSKGRGPDRRAAPLAPATPTLHGNIVVYGKNTSVININQPCSIYIGTAPPSPGSAATGTSVAPLINHVAESANAHLLTRPDVKKGHPITPRSPSAVLKSLLCKIYCQFLHLFAIPIQIAFCIQLLVFLNPINDLTSFGSGIYMCKNDCLPT